MVRVKTRWILARLEFEQNLGRTKRNDKGDGGALLERNQNQFPSRKEVFFALQDHHAQNFGIAGSAEAQEIQVRFCDPATRMVLIRIRRDSYPRVRATITLMTSIIRRRVVMSIVGVHGSVRTAKRATIEEVQRLYRQHFRQTIDVKQGNVAIAKRTRTECAVMEQTLAELHGIEF